MKRFKGLWVMAFAMCCFLVGAEDANAQCRSGNCGLGARVVSGFQRAVTVPRQVVANVQSVSAQESDFGALAFAQRLDRSRGLYHDRSFRGPEVVFKSSGVATREQAVAAWLASRKGHRQLLESGAITAIACHGTACVGRGKPIGRARAVVQNVASRVSGAGVQSYTQTQNCSTCR